jgi:hypothetical protein
LCYYVRTKAISTGAKHLALDMTKKQTPPPPPDRILKEGVLPTRPADSEFECFGCSS